MNHKQSYNGIPAGEMKQFLEEKYLQFNNPSFIAPDPVSIPHRYTLLQDREIAGFLTATIAWGRRDLILRSANNLVEKMSDSPYEFIREGNRKVRRCAERNGAILVEKPSFRWFSYLQCLFLRAGRDNRSGGAVGEGRPVFTGKSPPRGP